MIQISENYGLLKDEGMSFSTASLPIKLPVDYEEEKQDIGLWEEIKTRSKFEIESPKTLKCGTFNSLIEALTDVWVVEQRFNSTFFATYRSLFTPNAVLHKLFERFEVPIEFAENAYTIRQRVVNTVRSWVQDYVNFPSPSPSLSLSFLFIPFLLFIFL